VTKTDRDLLEKLAITADVQFKRIAAIQAERDMIRADHRRLLAANQRPRAMPGNGVKPGNGVAV
jgi:hypothetical protein